MARTFIGDGLVVEGDIEGSDELVVQGQVRGGSISGKEIAIEKSGDVEAQVQGETLRLAGKLVGDVQAQARVEIGAEGRLHGDVKAPRIAIADGAHFKGHIDTE
ncbi:MAG TPA: polymer-forming cytoskeletal protein [Myxococcales bacterium LLY-WYZ-16_1]|jgi:cytoskeletal protein CcmA (bactofilin family)|nr:polymer-forming cytoskeletal protein [Myxococcales bacterium LLY-WYZ-16_1]